MSNQDKSLQCTDCGTTFTFSAQDQESFAQKGYSNDPKRCPECRKARKTQRAGNNGNGYVSSRYGHSSTRQMFPVVCADCGKETQVPFEPRGDRPVYCIDCYRKVRSSK